MVQTGLAEEFLPELPGLALEQDPIHRHKDVLAHTLAVVDKTSPDRLLRLAALFHDVGKPRTRAFGDGGVTFHHHEVVGARMTRERMDGAALLARRHRHGGRAWSSCTCASTPTGWAGRTRRCGATSATPARCSTSSTSSPAATAPPATRPRPGPSTGAWTSSRPASPSCGQREELDAIRPDLDGTEVMARLGVPPGRVVGEALAFLLELRLDEGPLGAEEAGRRLDAWWAERSG